MYKGKKVISTRMKISILLVQLCLALSILVLFFYLFSSEEYITSQQVLKSNGVSKTLLTAKKSVKVPEYNVWLVFTKVNGNSPLTYKFRNLIRNIVNVSSVPLNFHVIIDNSSRKIALNEFTHINNHSRNAISFAFYNITNVAFMINDIVTIMTPHFSSKPGTYYSSALFYVSLGLHRIASENQEFAIILDCDLYFKNDIALLFREFSRFKSTALIGLAPELSPVYLHVLHKYKSKHKTTFGEYYHSRNISTNLHPKGFQGYNTGVVLLNLDKIRKSKIYHKMLSNKTVTSLTQMYNFRGHLGDQDYYTLIGFEYPHLIQTLNCGFNRQLCIWWKDHGYSTVFDNYFKCNHPVVVLHGNCNSKIP